MKILIVNKFLFHKGGSETYIFELGKSLESEGHQVQFFGMDNPQNIVGNRMGVYTSGMDFHSSGIKKLTYLFKIIYSWDARRKIRKILDDFMPDVVHLNNFNYQITPSVIVEICRYKRETGRKCEIVYTAHDYQLICPNHMLNNPKTGENCEKCLEHGCYACTKGRCIHGSIIKSLLGTMEAFYWKKRRIYAEIGRVICPSRFMEEKLLKNPVFRGKTVVLYNFVKEKTGNKREKQPYALYFGRISEEKGIRTLLEVCRQLPQVAFVFAGEGPLLETAKEVSNITCVGFKKGAELESLIGGARFSIYPSEWYENCPFSVMESQIAGTPVIGTDMGGIPELIQNGITGMIVKNKNVEQLREAVLELWEHPEKTQKLSENCTRVSFDTVGQYCIKLLEIYQGRGVS